MRSLLFVLFALALATVSAADACANSSVNLSGSFVINEGTQLVLVSTPEFDLFGEPPSKEQIKIRRGVVGEALEPVAISEVEHLFVGTPLNAVSRLSLANGETLLLRWFDSQGARSVFRFESYLEGKLEPSLPLRRLTPGEQSELEQRGRIGNADFGWSSVNKPDAFIRLGGTFECAKSRTTIALEAPVFRRTDQHYPKEADFKVFVGRGQLRRRMMVDSVMHNSFEGISHTRIRLIDGQSILVFWNAPDDAIGVYSLQENEPMRRVSDWASAQHAARNEPLERSWQVIREIVNILVLRDDPAAKRPKLAAFIAERLDAVEHAEVAGLRDRVMESLLTRRDLRAETRLATLTVYFRLLELFGGFEEGEVFSQLERLEDKHSNDSKLVAHINEIRFGVIRLRESVSENSVQSEATRYCEAGLTAPGFL